MTDPKKQKGDDDWRNVLIIVIVVLLVIITIGLIQFYSEEKAKKSEFEPEQLPDPIIEKEERLAFVEGEIARLRPVEEQLQRREFRILLFARILLGLIIIGLNVGYYFYDNHVFQITKQVSFNTALVLCYTFIAFVRYGSLEKFKDRIKMILLNASRKEHVHLKIELASLEAEAEQLKYEIEDLRANSI